MKKVASKGFSLVELMVVIAIIAILTTVAVPMYANYTVRSKLSTKLEELSAAKAAAAEYMSNNSDSLDYTDANLDVLPSGASVGDSGALVLDTSSIVADSTMSLVPTASYGVISWNCTTTGLTDSQIPSICQDSQSEQADNNNENNNANNSYLSSDFDVNSLVSNNTYDSAGSLTCSIGMASCYAYDNNQSVYDDEDEFESVVYPGATTAQTADDDDSLAQRIVANPSDGLTYTDDSQAISETFNSIDDIENSYLTDEQKQTVYQTIDIMRETDRFCGANSTFFAC